jgi:hypothetical protein
MIPSQSLVHILVREISPCFRERQDLAAKLIKTDDRQLALERITDYVTSRAARLFANFVEQLPEIRIYADCEGCSFHAMHIKQGCPLFPPLPPHDRNEVLDRPELGTPVTRAAPCSTADGSG